MRYLHTMVRVSNLEKSLDFYQNALDMVEIRRVDSEKGRFTLVFLAAKDDAESAKSNKSPVLELTYNWSDDQDHVYTQGNAFGHLAFEVDNIYKTCQKIMNLGITINRPPRDGYMAFIRSPDGISVELLQKGEKLIPMEPWLSMSNHGQW